MPTVPNHPEEDERRTRLKTVLSDGNLYQRYPWPWNLFMEQIPQVTVQSPCAKCEGTRSFVQHGDWFNPHFPTRGQFVWGKTIFGIFRCSDCQTEQHSYSIFFGMPNGVQTVSKVGQSPAKSIETPKEIQLLGGEAVDLYRKGRLCEANSFGIGSSAYYRRIVENSVNGLIDSAIAVAEEDGDSDSASQLRLARKETQFANKLKTAGAHLPSSLSRSGHNPVGVLFGLLSEGIHSMSDEDALTWAVDARELLVHVVQELDAKKKSSSKVKEVLARVKNRPVV